MTQTEPLLKVTDLNVHYGGIAALRGISLHVDEGEIVSVIGANGAGKSTLMRSIAGVKEYSGGSILYCGQPLPRHAHESVKLGITLVPEGRRIFAPLTVLENLTLGAYTRPNKVENQETLESVFTLFPVLKERAAQVAGTLSGGEQQMLAVGRALMSKPRLLLLDEPSLGLAPIIVDLMFDSIQRLNQNMRLTILLVEQNASLALELSHRAYVLETGLIKFEGRGQDLLSDQRISESYLGIAG